MKWPPGTVLLLAPFRRRRLVVPPVACGSSVAVKLMKTTAGGKSSAMAGAGGGSRFRWQVPVPSQSAEPSWPWGLVTCTVIPRSVPGVVPSVAAKPMTTLVSERSPAVAGVGSGSRLRRRVPDDVGRRAAADTPGDLDGDLDDDLGNLGDLGDLDGDLDERLAACGDGEALGVLCAMCLQLLRLPLLPADAAVSASVT